MINEKIGNLLTAEEVNVIAHQTNYAGVMAGGIAKSIKDDLLGPKGFFEYSNTCDIQKGALLGTVLYQTAVNGKTIADLFAQRNHGRVRTDYDALQKCLEEVEAYCLERGLTLGIPGRLGCGIAGGDWKYVYENIIVPIFENSSVMLYIYYFDDETYRRCQEELAADPDDEYDDEYYEHDEYDSEPETEDEDDTESDEEDHTEAFARADSESIEADTAVENDSAL